VISAPAKRPSPDGGIRVGAGARIGAGAILLPPVTIGEEAFVGAAALVRGDVEARTVVVVGTPAVFLRAVHDDELITMWRDEQMAGA
jgi:UDP-2-acetamido-3-amino-2,3-dideoxy-glucuronate N-acetyltransferase